MTHNNMIDMENLFPSIFLLPVQDSNTSAYSSHSFLPSIAWIQLIINTMEIIFSNIYNYLSRTGVYKPRSNNNVHIEVYPFCVPIVMMTSATWREKKMCEYNPMHVCICVFMYACIYHPYSYKCICVCVSMDVQVCSCMKNNDTSKQTAWKTTVKLALT